MKNLYAVLRFFTLFYAKVLPSPYLLPVFSRLHGAGIIWDEVASFNLFCHSILTDCGANNLYHKYFYIFELNIIKSYRVDMFTHKVKINFFNCDPAGILFYGRIYEVCHSAYESMIESFALKENYWNNDNYVVPIISSSAKYLVPVNYNDTLKVELSVSILKNSSFELQYICKNQNEDICAEVKTVHVCVGATTWKKKELSKEISNGLKEHLTVS